jgi:allose kinase
MQTIGLDIGGTNLRIGLVDEENRVAGLERVDQAEVLKGDALRSLADFIRDYMARHDPQGQTAAICAAVPAAISKDKAVVLNAPNINGFNGVNVKAVLQDLLQMPVFIEKDVNALLLYDLFRYNLDTRETIVACYAGTGLGNALYLCGGLYTGANGVAGELGHIPAWDEDTLCSCGNPGCVETFVGGKYLAQLQKDVFPQTAIGDLFLQHGDDPRLQGYIRHLAVPIAAEVNILDPQTLVIGGGVPAMAGFPREALCREILLRTRKPLPAENLQIVFSENGTENGVIGAGISAREQAAGR